jgi:allantoin racemase
MQIVYQLVGPMERTVLGKEELARREAFLNARAAPGTSFRVQSVAKGPPSIESAYDAAIGVPAMLDAAHRAEAEGADAIIIGCFSDPGIEPAREIVRIPVIGPGAASLHLAAQLGTRISVISPLAGRHGRALVRMRALGLESGFASVRGIGMAVLDLARQRDEALGRIVEAGTRAVAEDGADILVLGCLSMAFLDVTAELQERIGVPVVNPVIAAQKTAEMVAAMGLCHSKLAYPAPPKMELL